MATPQFQSVQKHLLFVQDKQTGWLIAIAIDSWSVCTGSQSGDSKTYWGHQSIRLPLPWCK